MAKSAKCILSFFMSLVLIISAFSSQAFAAGVETWYSDWVDEPTMTVTNNNLTPVKTMGVSGNLHIAAAVTGRPDLEPAGCPKVKMTVEIRDLSGNVLAKGEVREDDFMPQVHLTIPVTAGQKIQVFFDVSSVSYNPNGNYRIANISYSHEIY